MSQRRAADRCSSGQQVANCDTETLCDVHGHTISPFPVDRYRGHSGQERSLMQATTRPKDGSLRGILAMIWDRQAMQHATNVKTGRPRSSGGGLAPMKRERRDVQPPDQIGPNRQRADRGRGQMRRRSSRPFPFVLRRRECAEQHGCSRTGWIQRCQFSATAEWCLQP